MNVSSGISLMQRVALPGWRVEDLANSVLGNPNFEERPAKWDLIWATQFSAPTALLSQTQSLMTPTHQIALMQSLLQDQQQQESQANSMINICQEDLGYFASRA